jgi:UDP-4-amino-4-deoxy-L-arabinose formyltransferase/UDP-glucuronic acid dehydrogenase (UDP-4-keto-hexauronic acid decarboxylating)
MRIAYIGGVAAGKPILQAVEAVGNLVAVATSGDRDMAAAGALEAELLDTADLNTAKTCRRFNALDVDHIVNFNATVLFSQALLATPRIGAINFHPGLLPDYAGLNVHQWAMLNGEARTGATIHVITPVVDTGPVLARSTVDIDAADTGLTLYMKLLRSGAGLMAEVLHRVAESGFEGAEPQDLARRHLYRRRDRPSGRIDFSKAANHVHRFVRALSYRPMNSPLGVPFIQAPSGRIEPVGLTVTDRTRSPDTKPGTVVETDANLLKIACLDRIVAVEAAVVDGQRMNAVEAAGRVGLHAGSIV